MQKGTALFKSAMHLDRKTSGDRKLISFTAPPMFKLAKYNYFEKAA